MKVLNALAISMLPEGGSVEVRNVSLEEAQGLLRVNAVNCPLCGGDWGLCPHGDVTSYMGQFIVAESAIGHEGTAEVFGRLLEVPLPPNRVFVTLAVGEEVLVGSLNTRLPEGKVLSAEELAGLPVRWCVVKRTS